MGFRLDDNGRTRNDSIYYESKYHVTIPNKSKPSNRVEPQKNRVSGFEVAKDIMMEHQRAVCTNGRFASSMRTFIDEKSGNEVTQWLDQNKKIISESSVDKDMIMTITYYKADGKKNSELKISDNYPFFRGSQRFDENEQPIHSSGTRIIDYKT